VNDFALTHVSLPREEASGRSAADFFDFIIDGKSLRDRLRSANVGVLSHAYPSPDLARHLRLEGTDPLLAGLTLLYGCRQCLDTLCGGQAVKIDIVDGRVRWSEIQSYWIDLTAHESAEELQLRGTRVGPFEFDLNQYREALAPFLSSRA
jgi:hypothetical protein